jgi:hypothetical protein
LQDKPSEFLRLASLQAYLVFAQSEAKAWVWMREGRSFASEPRGLDEAVRVPALEIELPLSEVYTGLTFGSGPP